MPRMSPRRSRNSPAGTPWPSHCPGPCTPQPRRW
jgi:hypothetical protein